MPRVYIAVKDRNHPARVDMYNLAITKRWQLDCPVTVPAGAAAGERLRALASSGRCARNAERESTTIGEDEGAPVERRQARVALADHSGSGEVGSCRLPSNV